jgi:hypothetical protein
MKAEEFLNLEITPELLAIYEKDLLDNEEDYAEDEEIKNVLKEIENQD